MSAWVAMAVTVEAVLSMLEARARDVQQRGEGQGAGRAATAP